MFKMFIQRIIESCGRKDALNNVFYGENGIDMAFQRGKISWKDHQMLLELIEKLSDEEEKERYFYCFDDCMVYSEEEMEESEHDDFVEIGEFEEIGFAEYHAEYEMRLEVVGRIEL